MDHLQKISPKKLPVLEGKVLEHLEFLQMSANRRKLEKGTSFDQNSKASVGRRKTAILPNLGQILALQKSDESGTEASLDQLTTEEASKHNEHAHPPPSTSDSD